MITKETRLFRLAVSLVLTIALALGVVPVLNTAVSGSAGFSAQAATKKLPVERNRVESGLHQKTNIIVMVTDYNEKAKYTFKSNKKKVVSVSKKGIAKAKRYGTAKITITEKYKKKIRKATIKVVVKKASINKSFRKQFFGCAYWRYFDRRVDRIEGQDRYIYLVKNQNKKAKYEYFSGNKNILTIDKKGKILSIKKAGKVKITAKEKLKKKTRTVGKFTIIITKPYMKKKVIGSTLKLHYYGDYDSEKYEPALDDEFTGVFNLITVEESLYTWSFVCETKDEVDKLKKNVVKEKKNYPIVKGSEASENTFAAKEEKVLKSGDNPGDVVPGGVGTRYVAIFDGTPKKPVTYMGYVIVKVEEGKFKTVQSEI